MARLFLYPHSAATAFVLTAEMTDEWGREEGSEMKKMTGSDNKNPFSCIYIDEKSCIIRWKVLSLLIV